MKAASIHLSELAINDILEQANPYLRNDPFHRCPVCKQLTDNENMCDDCHDNMAFLLRWYEAAVRPKPKPYRPDQNE